MLAVFAGVGAMYSAWHFFRLLRRDRFAADTPLARIRSAAQGYVHLEGTAAPSADEGELRSPLTNRPCVWWSYKVEHCQSGRSRGPGWSALEQGSSVAPFTLHDTDGQCLVGPVGAEIIPAVHNVWRGSTPRPDGPPARAIQVAAALDDRPYRYTESLIPPGVKVTVLGELRSHSVTAEIDEKVRSIISAWKKNPSALLSRFDRDKDGELSMEEWEAVRTAARTEAQAELGGSGSHLSVVGATTHGQPFLIAPLDAKRLVKREKYRAVVAFAATILLVGLTAWLAQMGLMISR